MGDVVLIEISLLFLVNNRVQVLSTSVLERIFFFLFFLVIWGDCCIFAPNKKTIPKTKYVYEENDELFST